jgi:aminobenzoyl-glutamate utilization protein B
MEVYERANKIAEGAALMTNTTMSKEILGSAWPRHFNQVIAETMYQNIKQVGLPTWSDADQKLAMALQREVKSHDTTGLATKLDTLSPPMQGFVSGGSDDIGDISWKLPTVTLGFPSNIPGLQGHHWSNAVSMATPIAHKGVVAGAKAEAMTLIDFICKPQLVDDAWKYFREEQGMNMEYKPMVSEEDKPAIYLNADIMSEFRPLLQKYYYDESSYPTYLDQLGIEYPTVKGSE